MKIDELIEELERVRDQHGNLEINSFNETNYMKETHGYMIYIEDKEGTIQPVFIPD